MAWDIEIGETLRRTEVHRRYQGQRQGGISTPSNSNIMIFSDPIRSKLHGYNVHEGLQPDGSFHYAGQRRVGDMSFTSVNKNMRDSTSTGHVIRLFMVDGVYVTYAGAYRLSDPPHRWERFPDDNGDMRDGIVFHLDPIVANPDLIPVTAEINDVATMPWEPRDSSSYAVAAKAIELEATRKEFKLEERFGRWLQSNKHEVQRMQLRTGGRSLNPDLFDATASVLIEAKKSANSEDVRLAIGQVLDYQYCAAKQGIAASPALLLPHAPNADLVGLCKAQGISIYVPTGQKFKDCTV